ncbi:MAG: ice-binding family protein [Methanoregula sp.]
MTRINNSTGKIFSIVFTVALVGLMIAAIAPGAMGASAVDLGSAANYAILTKSGITTTGTTTINGNIGVSPIAATAMTGFGLTMDSSNQFSRSSLVNGGVYAANYAPPTPATMTTAISNMETAYTSAAGQTSPIATELYAGNLGGRTLTPGLYKWSTGVLIPSGTDLTLDANGNGGAIWVFQVAGDLTMDSASRMVLANGANADNVYWQIAGPAGAKIGSGSHAEGNILTQTAIVMDSGASLQGRALAQTAVTLIANTITSPSPSSVPAQSDSGTGDGSNTGVTTTQTLAPGQTLLPGQTVAPKLTTNPNPTRTKRITTTISTVVKGNSGINQAEVTGTENAGLVVSGTVVSSPGQGIGQPSGIVYQYIDFGPAEFTPVDQVVISFSVPVSWMYDNNLAPENVTLSRLDGNVWVELPTTYVSTGDGLVYYTAISPEFSRVAITGKFTSSTTDVPIVTAVAQTPVAEETTQEQLAPTQSPTVKSPVMAWIPIIALIGAMLIMAVVSGRKGKTH